LLQISWLSSLFIFIPLRILLGLHNVPESLVFIRQNEPSYVILSIWLSNTASAFLIATISVIYFILLILGIIYMAFVSSSAVIAAWLSGECPLAHALFGIVEGEAFILIGWLALKIRGDASLLKSLSSSWDFSKRRIVKLSLICFLSFLVLAIVEAFEVISYG